MAARADASIFASAAARAAAAEVGVTPSVASSAGRSPASGDSGDVLLLVGWLSIMIAGGGQRRDDRTTNVKRDVLE